MAGITDAAFLNKVIPYGFNVATLGGYNLDLPSINACLKIIERGRKEFYIPFDDVNNHISSEINKIKELHPEVMVSVNVRSTTPEPIVNLTKNSNLDIIEINCHCRQDEFLNIGCGQNMLKREDLEDFISTVVNNVDCNVSLKLRANVEGVDTLEIAKLAEDCHVDFLHVDAMNPGINDADFDLISRIADETNIFIIGNNSLNSRSQIQRMLDAGASGFSIARAVINGNLNFKISDF